MRKKSSSTYSAKKNLEMFGICAQVPKTVLVNVSLVPSIFRLAHAPEFVVASARSFITCGLGPTFHPRYARHTVEQAL